MKFDGDIFDTGPDYQRSKQSAFVISILVLLTCLAVPDQAGKFEFEALNVKVSAPLLVVHLLLLAVLSYAAYGYRVNRRRAFIEHTKLVRKYGDVSLHDALTGIKSEFEAILRSADALARDTAQMNNMVASINTLKRNYPASWLEDIAQHHTASLVSIINTVEPPIDTSRDELDRFIEQIKSVAQVPMGNYLHSVSQEFDNKVEELSNNRYELSINDMSIASHRMKEVAENRLPDMGKAVSSMESAMGTLSEKIAPGEVRFFYVENAAVLAALGCSGLFLLFRLAEHVPFRAIWQQLQSSTPV